MSHLLIAVPLAPVFAAVLVLLLGRRLPKRGAWLPVGATAFSLAALLALPREGVSTSVTWLALNTLTITVGLRLDSLSWFVGVLVAAVALVVNVYAVEYMQSEEGRPRFYAFMSLFAGAMLALVLADSLLLFFAAWELVGVASWGLIGFWHRDEAPRRAAQMAFLMTRLGDFGLLLGWLLVLVTLGTVDIQAFLAAVVAGRFAPPLLALLAILFFAASVGKSAQLPLTAWLPEAMAGPSPVSALIHSATMVAAGVYLVLRFFPLFRAAPGALSFVLWTGTITAVVAALVATAQADLKRILAWSTVSQLGEMMIALGLAGPAAALYHLTTHAVFKSGLFLAAGAVQHATGVRELQDMGGLARRLPMIAAAFGACALALAGFPLLSGFWSEEKIIAAATRSGAGWVAVMLLLILLAGVYISRATAGVFLRWPGAPTPPATNPGRLMIGATVILAAGAIFVGYLIRMPMEHVIPAMISAGGPGWGLRGSVMLASSVGLVFGTWRVRSAGPVPSFTWLAGALGFLIYRVSLIPARAAVLVSQNLWTEPALDKAARAAARAATRGADAVDSAETDGFAGGADRLASALWTSGGRLRGLETGKIYAYTAAVFVWAVLAAGLYALIWL
ncbi:MAG: NADH-quinone oxidoreductase subunit L [Acidobacteria bacterium]|nr:NADH-quinone oxidoreductase subunit L [Acidobacteriota bacterium]